MNFQSRSWAFGAHRAGLRGPRQEYGRLTTKGTVLRIKGIKTLSIDFHGML